MPAEIGHFARQQPKEAATRGYKCRARVNGQRQVYAVVGGVIKLAGETRRCGKQRTRRQELDLRRGQGAGRKDRIVESQAAVAVLFLENIRTFGGK